MRFIWCWKWSFDLERRCCFVAVVPGEGDVTGDDAASPYEASPATSAFAAAPSTTVATTAATTGSEARAYHTECNKYRWSSLLRNTFLPYTIYLDNHVVLWVVMKHFVMMYTSILSNIVMHLVAEHCTSPKIYFEAGQYHLYHYSFWPFWYTLLQ